MPSGYVTPMVLTTGVLFANNWINSGYQTPGGLDLKILLEGGIATALLGLVNQIPGMDKTTTTIAWITFIGSMIVQGKSKPLNPPFSQNLLKLTGK